MGVTDDPKATEKGKGAVPGQTPEGEKVSPTGPKTYTKESEEMAVEAGVHKALSAAGRVSTDTAAAKQLLEDAKATSDATKAEREQSRKDREEAEREAVKTDPEALKSLETKQANQREKDRLADQKQEQDATDKSLKVREEAARVFNRTKIAAEVAVAKGVDVDALLKLAKEDTKEAMEAVAALLLEKKSPLKTDAGTTIGGKALADLSPDEKIKVGLKKKLGG